MVENMKPTTVALTSNRYQYNYSITGAFLESELDLIQKCLVRFFEVVGVNLGGVLISSGMCIKVEKQKGNNFRLPYQICLDPRGLTEWTVTHELGHALDASNGWELSRQMKLVTGSGFPIRYMHKLNPRWKLFWYRVGSPPPPCGVDKNFNSLEDFAETVTAFIFPDIAYEKAKKREYPYEKWGYTHFHDTPRGKYFYNLITQKEFKAPS